MAMPASRRVLLARAMAASAAVMTASTTVSAQQQATPPADAQVAAWRVECTGDGKVLDCRAVQQVFHRESRQLLIQVLVRPAADGKTGAMVLQLPLGLNLTEPIAVKVDNGAAERQAIQTCTNVGCFVSMTASDKLVAAMRTGRELKVTVQDANKKPIDMSLPLLGFALAFDKAK
jgi:invasion protein IalB